MASGPLLTPEMEPGSGCDRMPLLVEFRDGVDDDRFTRSLSPVGLERDGRHPLGMNALSLMLTRRYHAGGGTLPYFGSHRIRHGTATLLANNGMPLEELSRYMGHASTQVTRRYAVQTPDALGERAAEALARAGLAGR